MDVAAVVMIILCIIYVPIWIWVWRKPESAAKYHLVKYGPTVMIKTALGIKAMDKLGRYRRFWRFFGFMSRLISVILFFLMMYMLVMALIALPSRLGGGGIGIKYALAIPGFNPMLPLTYGIIALFVAMVVHEMGHGIQSRANDCEVDSTGLLYGVVPLGAFCEPNEEDLAKASRGAQMDVYSAGISVNTILAIISFALMVLVIGSVAVADFDEVSDASDLPGVYYIDEDSPAYKSKIPASALIIGIKEEGDTSEFHPVQSKSETRATSIYAEGMEITPLKRYIIQYMTENGEKTTTVPIQIGAFIRTVANNSPADDIGLKTSTFIYCFSVKISDGADPDDPSDDVYEDHPISNAYDFFKFMESTEPGDKVKVLTATVSYEGEIATQERQVTLSSSSNSGSSGYLGVSVNDSGFTMTTPTIMIDSAKNPFYNAEEPYDYIQGFFKYLSGPINGLDPIPNAIRWWYDAPAGELLWISMKTLYWIFWLDILLAISNALPAYPFDGGFLFEGGINWLLERFGIKDDERRKKLSESASSAVSTVVLIMFCLVLLTFII